jgi:YaiO family outer membrane protein
MLSARAAGQDDVLVKARAAASSGNRAEALSMLEARLAEVPRDVDARLVYGLILSWEGRYDEARVELQRVLAQTPNYTDARVALMNVEYWSGRSTEAREQADTILSTNPGNTTARAVRERLAAASRPWWSHTSYSFDTFNDGRDAWQEAALSLVRRTPVGSVILRGTQSARFDMQDQLIELEFYPRFRPGTYAFIGVGYAPDPTLYPKYRTAFDLYQSLGRGFEVSGGARYLDFETPTEIYVATMSKYIGNWMLTGKLYRVPGEGDLGSTSYWSGFRYYFGSDGTSYTGLSYGHGLNRDEIRNTADLTMLHSDTVRQEMDWLFHTRFRIFVNGGVSREDRVDQATLWQTSVTSGFSIQF